MRDKKENHSSERYRNWMTKTWNNQKQTVKRLITVIDAIDEKIRRASEESNR